MADNYHVTCPHCGKITLVELKKGYTATANPQCNKCGHKFLVRYSWPAWHNEPDIYEVKR